MRCAAYLLILSLVLSPHIVFATQVSTNKPVDRTVTKLILSYKEGQSFKNSFRTIVALGPSANPTLFKLANDPKLETHQRWTAARAIGRIGDTHAISPLEGMLKSRDPVMRMASLRALGDLGARKAVPAIINVAEKDEAMVVRSTAVKTLGKLRAKQAVSTIENAIWDERNFIKGQGLFIRHNAVYALGQMQSREATPILIKVLDDRDETMHPVAVRSLQKITGLKFEAKNQATINGHWKNWWEKELKRIPQLMPEKKSTKI